MLPYVKNKFILTILIFIIWLLFVDHNNLIDRAKELRHLRQLEKDKSYYIERSTSSTGSPFSPGARSQCDGGLMMRGTRSCSR